MWVGVTEVYTLRSTAPEASRSDLQPVTLVSNLGTPCALPFPQIVGPSSLVTGTIHQLDMQVDPRVHQDHSDDTVSAPQLNKPGRRGDRSCVERKAEIRKNNPEQYQKELQRKREGGRESTAQKKQKKYIRIYVYLCVCVDKSVGSQTI